MKNLILVWTLFIAILTAAVANFPLSLAQEQIENNSNNNTKITKTSTNSYIIVDDGPELVGAFDIVYTITGSSESLNKSKESIVSIVQDDLDNSPTIGYIRAAAAAGNQTQTEGVGLPNPFVDLQTINSTVIQQLSNSINSASALNLTIVEIKCDFGMNIRDWKCEDHGIF
ncbi:MAG TPA: hypothetical protein VE130_05360 [Nitrososphaeraceae archaeon]|jgi:hypothetical protein|nr:hypothetical protein [Nitrososphaeraceae archaeon]